MIQAKESYWFTGISHFELWNRVCFHPPASLNNETICCENSEGNCAKTMVLRSRKFLYLNSECWKALVPVKIFQFQDLFSENRFLDIFEVAANGL